MLGCLPSCSDSESILVHGSLRCSLAAMFSVVHWDGSICCARTPRHLGNLGCEVSGERNGYTFSGKYAAQSPHPSQFAMLTWCHRKLFASQLACCENRARRRDGASSVESRHNDVKSAHRPIDRELDAEVAKALAFAGESQIYLSQRLRFRSNRCVSWRVKTRRAMRA